MGRRRKAWLVGGNGVRKVKGRRMPGYYAAFYEYTYDGRRIHRTKHFLKHALAREWVKRFNARHDLKEAGQIVPIPLSEATREFLAGCSALSHDTRVHYASALGMLHGIIGDLNVCEITGAHVDGFVSARLDVSRGTTVAKHLRSLRRFFRWAADRGYADANPVAAATSVPKGNVARERPAITDKQLGKLIAALDTEDRRLAVWLAMTTGLDRGVIERLTPESVNLENRCICVKRPKTSKMLVVPIHAALVPLLAARLERTDPCQPLLLGLARQSRDRDWWSLALAAAGLTSLWFRDLRAVASSRLLRHGVALTDVQRLLSHASPETTARHYYIPDHTVAARLDELDLPGLSASEER